MPAQKLLLISEIFPPAVGGSGRWLSELYARVGVSRLVITDSLPTEFWGYQDPDYVERLPMVLPDTGALSVRGGLGYFRLARRVRSSLQGSVITRAQAARVVPEGWLLLMLKKIWAINDFEVFAHGEEVNLDSASDGGVMSSRQHRWMARLVFKNCSRVIANSRNTAKILSDQWRIPECKIVVLNPAIDTTVYKPAEDIGSIKSKLDWQDNFVVLTVGRLQKRKGHDAVIAAVQRLRRTIPGFKYVIAGSGEEYGQLSRLVKEMNLQDVVQFERDLTDSELIEHYQACDVFVLANRQVGADIEGFGIVLLEAAACGKPTITGRSGGTGEAIEDGVTGFTIDATDPEVIAETIERLHQSPSTMLRLSQAGRIRAEEQFDWSNVVKSFTLAR